MLVLAAGPLVFALEMGVASGDGAEMKAESEESEPVEESTDSVSKLQASEQKRRPWWVVTSSPCRALWQELQQKQEALACQCCPWRLACSLSTPKREEATQSCTLCNVDNRDILISLC